MVYFPSLTSLLQKFSRSTIHLNFEFFFQITILTRFATLKTCYQMMYGLGTALIF